MEGDPLASDGSCSPDQDERLMDALGYRFRQVALLERALTHRSCVNEQGRGPEVHNERLEFLGDAVVDLVVGDVLMRRLPTAREGELSKLRALVVSAASLARGARGLQLGGFLRLGRGEEQTGGRDKPSILADALEALLGAIYLDGGFESARDVVVRVLGPVVEAAVNGELRSDHKTRLQELAQGRLRVVPVYDVVGQRGPDHAKVFSVAVSVKGERLAQAEGHSKKEAEQEAARQALEVLAE